MKKKCKKKYEYGGNNKPLPEQYNDYNQYLSDLEDWENNGNGSSIINLSKNDLKNKKIDANFKKITDLVSYANIGLSEIDSAKMYNKEKQKYYRELQPKFQENNPVLNNIPMYAKYGINNIDVPDIEAESGEIYKDINDNLLKIKDSAPTHEDGGVNISDAKKVLSATLKISPEDLKKLTGVIVDKKLDYSKALESVNDFYKKPLNKLKLKIENNIDRLSKNKKDIYLQNSLDINSKQYDSMPNEQKAFNMLFNHQEITKLLKAIPNKEQFGNGGPNDKEYKGKKYRKTSIVDDSYNYDGSEDGKDFFSKVSSKSIKPISGGTFTEADKRAIINKLQNGEITPDMLPKFVGKDEVKNYIDYYKPKIDDLVYRGKNDRGEIVRIGGVKDLNSLPEKKSLSTPAKVLENFTVGNTQNNKQQAKPQQDTKSNDKEEDTKSNDGLNWYDIAGELLGLGEDRIGAKYNPVEFNKIKLKLLNPMPALEQGKRDYNSILNILPNNGSGMGNLANVFQSKYNIDNQILGDYENKNSQIRNQEEMYNANVGDRQSSADQQSREVFEQKYLGSLEAYRQQKMTNLNSIFDKIAQNKRFNIEKNLLEKTTPNFKMGNYNGKQKYFMVNGKLIILPISQQATTKKKR